MEVGAALVADREAAEMAGPRRRAFDDPPVPPEARARVHAPARDAERDAAGAALAAAPGVVVPFVGVRLGRARRGRPRRPERTGGAAPSVGASMRLSWRLAALRVRPSGVPRASATTCRVVPG